MSGAAYKLYVGVWKPQVLGHQPIYSLVEEVPTIILVSSLLLLYRFFLRIHVNKHAGYICGTGIFQRKTKTFTTLKEKSLQLYYILRAHENLASFLYSLGQCVIYFGRFIFPYFDIYIYIYVFFSLFNFILIP